ncbi:hypothetical protein ACOSQ3_033189 [Xanthoceras sorbifolium]
MASSTTKLRLFVDTKAGKVLFAEADKDFIDFLIYLLSLPIATAVRILKDKNMHLAGVGSLGHLSETYIKTGKTKDLLINPRGVLHPTEIPLLLSDLNSRKVYMCSGLCSGNMSMFQTQFVMRAENISTLKFLMLSLMSLGE